MARYQNAFLIYNPNAGKLRRKRDLIDRAVARLREAGHSVTAMPTTGPGTAPEIAHRCVERGADLILAAGGDGTINEVLNGLVHSAVPLGVLPGGTANVLAVELGIGTSMLKAAEEISAQSPRRIALGKLEVNGHERHFAMMAGIGLDAMIVYNIHAGLKSALGKGAYWLAGFGQLGRRLTEFPVRVDGADHLVSFALISRVRNYGGDLEIARGASLLGDDFEAVLFQGSNSLPYAKYLAGVMTKQLHNMRGVRILRAKSVELPGAADPRVYIQVDGEHAGRLPASIQIVPGALSLLVPPKFLNRSA